MCLPLWTLSDDPGLIEESRVQLCVPLEREGAARAAFDPFEIELSQREVHQVAYVSERPGRRFNADLVPHQATFARLTSSRSVLS